MVAAGVDRFQDSGDPWARRRFRLKPLAVGWTDKPHADSVGGGLDPFFLTTGLPRPEVDQYLSGLEVSSIPPSEASATFMILKAVGAIVAVLFVSVVVVAVGLWQGFVPVPGSLVALLAGARGPEHSARYYPSDTLAYGWATLAPGGGQLTDMQEVWERFNGYPAFADLVDELKLELTEDTGIDFDTEVVPWVGPEISAGLLAFDIEGETPVAVAMIGVRDQDAAAAFLTKWREYVAREFGSDFDTGSHRGVNTWVDADAYQAYALADDWLVYATDEGTLYETLNRIEDGGDALAGDANFTAARAALPERRFASFYLNYRQGVELLDDVVGSEFGVLAPGMVGPGALAEQAPDWVAGSAAWIERGMMMEVVAPTVSTFGLEVAELQDPAGLVPVDTLGFVAGAFDPEVDHWRTALGEHDLAGLLPDAQFIDEINDGVAEMASGDAPQLHAGATLADVLDLAFWLVNDFTGIDLEADFFDHLSGQAILAVRDFDFGAVADDAVANAVDVVAMLSYREGAGDGLTDTMDEVANLLRDHIGMETSSLDVGADDDATVFDLGLLGIMAGGPIGYRPGYVLHDRYLTLGTTENALATTVDVQNGEVESLSSDAEYRRAADELGSGGQFLGYVDVQRIVQFEADDLELEPDEYDLLREGLGVVVFGSSVAEDYSRGAAVLTLFPE